MRLIWLLIVLLSWPALADQAIVAGLPVDTLDTAYETTASRLGFKSGIIQVTRGECDKSCIYVFKGNAAGLAKSDRPKGDTNGLTLIFSNDTEPDVAFLSVVTTIALFDPKIPKKQRFSLAETLIEGLATEGQTSVTGINATYTAKTQRGAPAFVFVSARN